MLHGYFSFVFSRLTIVIVFEGFLMTCTEYCTSPTHLVQTSTDSRVLFRSILPSLSSQSDLEEFNEELELKQGDIAQLHEKEKTLTAAFQASLGKENKFEEFLTKVFKKKIKRIKIEDQTGSKGEQK